MLDRILEGFLERQFAEGMQLASESDLLDLVAARGDPPRKYIAEFACRGLVRSATGEITEANRFAVGIYFPPDYLRRVELVQVLTWLGPRSVFHPNISDVAPVICVGRLTPGTPLVDLLYQIFEIITFAKVTMREDDSLNHRACVWARQNLHRLPIDRRPLKRRALQFQVEVSPSDREAREAGVS